MVTRDGKLQLIDHGLAFPPRDSEVRQHMAGDPRLGGCTELAAREIPEAIKAPYRAALEPEAWAALEARLLARSVDNIT